MNDASRLSGRPGGEREGGNLTVAADLTARAFDALQDGDEGFAADLLALALTGQERSSCRCSVCGRRFQWPGLKEVHVCAGATLWAPGGRGA